MQKNFIDIQHQLAQSLIIPDDKQPLPISAEDLIFTFDIQYKGDIGYLAIDVRRWESDRVGVFTGAYPVTTAYQPGFFAFREGPVLQKGLEDLIEQTDFRPSLLVIDGHGTAHPRKLGVASWLGIQTDFPSIGVAKETLVKYTGELAEETGATLPVTVGTPPEMVGHVLRSQDGINPIFVSCGHRVSQQNAVKITMGLRSEYRIIEPIRIADQAARQLAKEASGELVAGTFERV